MVSFDEVGEMLEDISLSLPKDFFKELNGGINLLPDTRLHPESIGGDLFIMGEYCHNNLGRYINIYYGSVMMVHAHLSPDRLKIVLEQILKHEFVHHLEALAGEKDLKIIDDIRIEEYKKRKR